MISDLIPVSLDKIMQSKNYTAVILGALDKKFTIYTESGVGKLMQLSLTETETKRPLTHELLSMILEGIGAKLKQVVIVDVEDSVYYARIFIEQKIKEQIHIIEIDARPSDSLVLALMSDVPLYCTREVLDKTHVYSEKIEERPENRDRSDQSSE